MRVLVIEDSPDFAAALCDLLGLFGHQAEPAHTGPAGLAAARRRLPEVVLCDLGLPGMDGYAVARELRADPRTATTRLVALTGYGQASDVARTAAAGFSLHLVKPVAPDRLKRLLSDWEGGHA